MEKAGDVGVEVGSGLALAEGDAAESGRRRPRRPEAGLGVAVGTGAPLGNGEATEPGVCSDVGVEFGAGGGGGA